MTDGRDHLTELQERLRTAWKVEREATDKLVSRDATLVTEIREYFSGLAQLLLRVLGEELRLNGSDRYLDVEQGKTRVNFEFIQEGIKNRQFGQLGISIELGEKMVSVAGRTPRVKTLDSILYEVNEIVFVHFGPGTSSVNVAGDFFHLIKRG